MFILVCVFSGKFNPNLINLRIMNGILKWVQVFHSVRFSGVSQPHVIARHLVQQCTSYGLSEFVGHVFKVLLGKETVLIVL